MLNDPWVPLKDHPLLLKADYLLRLIFEGIFIIGLLVSFRLCLPRVLPGFRRGWKSLWSVFVEGFFPSAKVSAQEST